MREVLALVRMAERLGVRSAGAPKTASKARRTRIRVAFHQPTDAVTRRSYGIRR